MLQNGVDVRTLQELLGHEKPEHHSDIHPCGNPELRTAARANPLSRFTRMKNEPSRI
jgi:hypothetical protein